MEKSVKTVVRMSVALYNLRVLCRFSSANFFQKSFCHTLKKETLPPSIYNELGEEPSEIYTYLEKNQGFLSGQHCIQALQKLKNANVQIDEKNQKGLDQLCNELKKRIRTIDVPEAVAALAALTKLNVPTQSVIYESLLQIIRSNINLLTIDKVISLRLNLKDASKTPLVEAIQVALPIIFKIQLPRVDRNNINLLSMCLVFATKMEIKDEELIRFILDTILKYKQEIPIGVAKFIFNSLRFIPMIAAEYMKLIYLVQNVLLNQISTLNYTDAMTILRSMANTRSHLLYNEHLVDTIVNSVIIEENLSFEKGAEALKMLIRIGHDQVPLLDYLATKCFEQKDLIKNADPIHLSLFVSAMAMSDYKPVFWDTIQEQIMTNEFVPIYEKLTELVHNLAVLDSYSLKLLGNVFAEHTESKVLTAVTKNHLVKLYQIVKTTHLGYDGPYPLEKNPNDFFDWSQYNSKTFPLLNALNYALGGSEFVKTKVGTKLGHFIDHVAVYKVNEDSPISINQKGEESDNFFNTEHFSNKPITFLEDIPVSQENEVILFLDIPPEGYTVNTMQLKGHWNSYIRTLEAMDYMVIQLCSAKWLQLREKERIPYILHAIRLKRTIFKPKL